jgi:hypothetical protein
VAQPAGVVMRKLALLTTFWGQRFADFFERYCIPSLLTAGNLPRLKTTHEVTILLYTEQATYQALARSPQFQRLTQVAAVRPVFFDSFRASGMPSHWEPWHHAVVHNTGAFDAFALLIPDCVYVKDAFSRVAAALETADVVYFPTPEVCLEVVTQRFDQCFTADGALELDGLQMADVVVDFMHPKHAVGDFRARYFATHPEFFVAASKGRLALSHAASHSMGFRTDAAGVSYTFNPLQHGLRLAFLDILGVGCEPTLKYYDQYFHWPVLTLRDSRTVNLAGWARSAREPGNRVYADTENVIELRDGHAVAQYRAPRAHPRARATNRQLDYAENLYRLYEAADIANPGMRQCIALAACLPAVRARLKRLGPALTILLPVGKDPIDDILRAIEQGADAQAVMIEFLMLHVLPGHHRLRAGQYVALERVATPTGPATQARVFDADLRPSMTDTTYGLVTSIAHQLTDQQRVFQIEMVYGAPDRLRARLAAPPALTVSTRARTAS